MSDDHTTRILAAIEHLEQGQTRLRVDLMARMDRLQHRLDLLDEHFTVGLGHSDKIEIQARAVAEESRLTSEQIRSFIKLLRQLEARVTQLEEKPAS